jgi:hypothetical protein
MTQPPRTTESISRDNAAIRDIMLQIRELTVPDRATLALGLIGHLATMMNRGQMSKLLAELREEAEKVQDVPPARQRDLDERTASDEADVTSMRAGAGSNRVMEQQAGPRGVGTDAAVSGDPHAGVGQAGRGEFRSDRLV